MSKKHTLILWDLDGTLCPHNARFHHNAVQAVAQAAIDMGANISMPNALKQAQAHYPGQRTAVQFFVQKFGYDEDQMFQKYYDLLDTDFLNVDTHLMQAFDLHQSEFEHGILTNASQSWINKVLSKMKINTFFNPAFLFGYEALGKRLKTKGTALKHVIKHTEKNGYNKNQIIVVDDKKNVLKHVIKFDIKTALVSNEEKQISKHPIIEILSKYSYQS